MESLLEYLPKVFPPGTGRQQFVLQEVDVAMGRPDVIVLNCSPTAVNRFAASGLRLPSFSAARVLDPAVERGAAGISSDYEVRLSSQLSTAGWTARAVRESASIVAQSLGIEAKIKEVPRALRQVARFRSLFSLAAIATPSSLPKSLSPELLESYGIGMICPESPDWVWALPSRAAQPSIAARLWLLELLIRARERGAIYTPSRSRKRSIAIR